MNSSTQPLAGDALLRRLKPIAQRVGHRATSARSLVGHPASEAETQAEFLHLCEVAAFYAYLDLEGDPDNPSAFLWEKREVELQRRAYTWLTAETQNPHTTYYDRRSRARPRQRSLEPVAWDSWTFGVPREHVQERALRENQLQLLERELPKVLDEAELWLVHQVFFVGKRLRQVAQEYAAFRPQQYVGAVGWRKAEKMLEKRYTRALERMRHALGPQWKALLQDEDRPAARI